MIVDNFKNCAIYYGLNPRLKRAFEYLKSINLLNIELGRYEIDGEKIYMNVEEYTTKTLSNPEFHRKYIDIQLLAYGEEMIGYCPISDLLIKEEYDEKKDLGFGQGVLDFIKLTPQKFMIFFPQDAHQPCMAVGEPKKAKKIVVKVRIDD